MDMTSSESHRPVGNIITRWWHRISRNWAGSWELNKFDSNELRNIASDVGGDVSELRTLAGRWPESADLLPRRLDALNIDMQGLSREQPQLANDLKKHCSLCAVKGQCEHDLDKHPGDPVWQHYCPNTMTLLAISKANVEQPKNPEAGL